MCFPPTTPSLQDAEMVKIKGLGGQMFEVLPPKFRQDVTVSEWREGAAARARAHSTISTSFFFPSDYLVVLLLSKRNTFRFFLPFAFDVDAIGGREKK